MSSLRHLFFLWDSRWGPCDPTLASIPKPMQTQLAGAGRCRFGPPVCRLGCSTCIDLLGVVIHPNLSMESSVDSQRLPPPLLTGFHHQTSAILAKLNYATLLENQKRKHEHGPRNFVNESTTLNDAVNSLPLGLIVATCYFSCTEIILPSHSPAIFPAHQHGHDAVVDPSLEVTRPQ